MEGFFGEADEKDQEDQAKVTDKDGGAILVYYQAMKHEKDRPTLTKLCSYLPLLERANPLRYGTISNPSPPGQKLSPEELEEQKRQYQRFLLLQTLRT